MAQVPQTFLFIHWSYISTYISRSHYAFIIYEYENEETVVNN